GSEWAKALTTTTWASRWPTRRNKAPRTAKAAYGRFLHFLLGLRRDRKGRPMKKAWHGIHLCYYDGLFQTVARAKNNALASGRPGEPWLIGHLKGIRQVFLLQILGTIMKTFVAKPHEVKRDWYVIDAKGKVLGRVAGE